MGAVADFSRYHHVIAYSRFSSRRQAQGSSETRQAGMAEQWAEANNVTLSPLSATDKGLSGFHGKNLEVGHLGKILEAVEAGAIQTPALLLVEAQDRFGRRPPLDAMQQIFNRCLNNALDLLLLDRNLLITRDLVNSDVSCLLRLVIEIDAAHKYSERLSRRMRQAHQHGRSKIAAKEVVRPGWAPTWIDLVDGEWQLNSYAPTVRRVLQLIADHGYNATAKLLTEEGLVPPRGKLWTQGSVASLVQSEAIAGGRVTLRRDPSSVVWDYYPALMPRLEWQALLARIASRSGSPAHGGSQQNVNYIGQGVTYCAGCGRPAGGRVCSFKSRSTGERQTKRYVRCRGRGDGACDHPALPLAEVHANVLTRLSAGTLAQLFPQQEQSKLTALHAKVAGTQQQIEEQQVVVTNGEQQISALLATAPDAVPVVAKAVAAARQRIEALEAELHQQRVAVAAIESDSANQLSGELKRQAQRLFTLFATGYDTPVERRQINTLLRRLEVRIVVDGHQEQIGLAIADGPIDWQPLAPYSRRYALASGMVNPIAAVDTATGLQVAVAGGVESGATAPAGDQPGVVTVISSDPDATVEEVDELLRQQGLEPATRGDHLAK